jgi:serine/threonine protein kinase
MTDIFEPNWVEKIPFNYNEISSVAKVDKWQNLPSHIFENRKQVTETLLNLPPSTTTREFVINYGSYMVPAKHYLVANWANIGIDINTFELKDSLIISENSLIDRVIDFFNLQMTPDEVKDFLINKGLSDLVIIPALILILNKKRINNNFQYFVNLRVVNGYTQSKKLGKGTYGTVYKVTKNNLEYADKEVSQLDLNEVNILCTFDHPNILKAIDFFKDPIENSSHIILDLAEGSLSDEIEKSKNININTKNMWMYQILSAANFFHKKGYYHCDIKPDNILIKNGNAILADFGLAYPFEYDQTFCGTPTWTAPEGLQSNHHGKNIAYRQVQNYQSIDIFALGCVLVYIYTGKPLFDYQKFPDITIVYDVYLKDYKKVIANMNMNKLMTNLIEQMCAPLSINRIETIEEVLKHPFFKKLNYDVPIPGVLIQIPSENYVSDELFEAFKWIMNIFVKYKCHILLAYVTISMAKVIHKIKGGKAKINVAACAIVADELLGFNNLEQVKWNYEINDLKTMPRKDIFELVFKIPYMLNGKLRTPLLYDIAVSFQEAMFGIGCLISGCNISIDQLHLDYTSNETAKILQNRLDKNSILTVDEYNDIFADTFRKNKDNLEEIFKMLQ